jgi:hypothetical protein
MDEVRIVRRRTHVWPVVIALIVLAFVIAFALFALRGGPMPDQGANSPHTAPPSVVDSPPVV